MRGALKKNPVFFKTKKAGNKKTKSKLTSKILLAYDYRIILIIK